MQPKTSPSGFPFSYNPVLECDLPTTTFPSLAAVKQRPSVWQVWNTEDQQEEVLAMVVRMGLNSCMGGMIRELIAPAWQRKDKISLVKVRAATALAWSH